MTELQKYYLHLADNAYILSHRLSEYCSRGPFLEEDLANTNVALDLIGISENIYEQLAKELQCNPDDFIHQRSEQEFLNCQMVELPNKDFAHLIVRQFFMDAFNYYLYSSLVNSPNEFLKIIGLKSLKEITYHLKRSSEWMIRLGKGTNESKERIVDAIETIWPKHSEFFTLTEYESYVIQEGIVSDYKTIQKQWVQKVKEIFFMSELNLLECKKPIQMGKNGFHTEYLGSMLNAFQYLALKYPDACW